jgi:calcium-dependent protein kinase
MIKENPTIKYGKKTFVGKSEGLFLDNYDVIKQLGKGGYGKVYEVKNKKSGEIRACKHLSKLSIKNLEKFEREINILINSDHPNIVKIYEIYESQRSLYIVMEECKGGEVFDRIIDHIQSKNMYSEKDAAEMLLQVMSAVEYCHNNGICHRDLKPENLLYLRAGSGKNNPIRVIDFGLSQVISPEKKLKTRVGTAYYVSPEILKGDYTEKCDVWSAGVILYIFLSGDPPFNGPNDSAIYSKIAQMKFTFPEKKWSSISKEAKDLITHMIAPEPQRYTAKQVIEHPWFKNASSVPISATNFNTAFFIDYVRGSQLKKMSLLYIASRLDENEIENLKKAFEAFDNCKDGQITFDELRKGLLQLKTHKLNENDIIQLFKSIDVDQNGKIDYTVFLAATIQRVNYLKNERLYEAFCMFDKDKSGNITKDELLRALKAEKSQEKEIEKYIKAVDKNGDGKIDYKEFLELMGAQQ